MTRSTTTNAKGQPKAQHGARNEVNWEGGSGRQPYANQESVAEGVTHRRDEVSEGDRGEQSGRNLEQLDEAKRKP